ncbi:MAG: amidohydrolase family protein [Gemmatimonadales bacterium]
MACLVLSCAPGTLEGDGEWDVTRARGRTRVVEFSTDEGTWMSVDISADGRWIVFDLLAHIYRVPATGGAAECLSCGSGAALNYQPRYSPDGNLIAFVSDRGGQENLWIMRGDGSDPRPVHLDLESRMFEPAWTPDGSAIVATRYLPDFRGYYHPQMQIWRFPVDGSAPELLAKAKTAKLRWPSVAPDGASIYFYTAFTTGSWVGTYDGFAIQRRDLETGRTEFVRPHPGAEPDPDRNPYLVDWVVTPGYDNAELAPEVSPDGRYLAYVTRRLGRPLEFRGHRYGPRSAIVLRDLRTGQERVVADPITTDLARIDISYSTRVVPGYAWTKDSKSLVYSEGGKIKRVSLETGQVTEIPFTATVRRELSEAPRSRVSIDADTLEIGFLQWPSGSPDGARLAFVGAGRLYLANLPGGRPEPIAPMPDGTVQLTPAWSPDGTRIAFASWHDNEQGQVWLIQADGTRLTRLTTTSGRYLHPAWSPDGKRLLVVKGPGPSPRSAWTGWEVAGPWEIVEVTDGSPRVIATVPHETRPHVGADGRVYYYRATERTTTVVSVDFDGAGLREHSILPRLSGSGVGVGGSLANLPLLSSDGRFVAFEAAQSIYVSPSGASRQGFVENDPELAVPDRVRLGTRGGAYHRWRDQRTVEFVSGSVYGTYDVIRGTLTEQQVALRIPRASTARGSIGFRDAKIVTARGDTVIERGDLVVRDGRIACVGTCSLDQVDRVVDATGKVIIPGLVDTHGHHTDRQSEVVPARQPELEALLAYGVTTIIDPATRSKAAFPLSAMIEAGTVLGPRTFSTGEIAAGWGDHLEIERYADARYQVDRRVDWGATSLKEYRHNKRAQRQMFLEAARQRGVTVTAEGNPFHHNVGAIIDGQTGWEHFLGPVRIFRDAALFYGLAGAVYAPTLSICGHNLGSLFHYRARHDLLHDAKYTRFIPRRYIEDRLAVDATVREDEYSVPIVAEGVKDVVEAGGWTVMGAHGEQAGVGAHWDLWAFVPTFSPLEAIRIATHDGARFHGLENELGSIRVGLLADLVVLGSDPLVDIQNSMDIALVMKGGRLFDGGTLDQLWPESRTFVPVVE